MRFNEAKTREMQIITVEQKKTLKRMAIIKFFFLPSFDRHTNEHIHTYATTYIIYYVYYTRMIYKWLLYQ